MAAAPEGAGRTNGGEGEMKKNKRGGFRAAQHQAKRFALLVAYANEKKAGILWGALLGAIIAAAIGGLLILAGGAS